MFNLGKCWKPYLDRPLQSSFGFSLTFNLVYMPNRSALGNTFTEQVIQSVWEKGTVIPGKSSAEFRMDKCGATMQRSQHGNTNSVYGWEIDHIVPLSKGGSDALSNLQPLQWENNRSKGDGSDSPATWCKIKT